MKVYLRILQFAKSYKLYILISLLSSILYVFTNALSLWIIGSLLSSIMNPDAITTFGTMDSFTDKINESSYIEKINDILNHKQNNYHNFVSCIVSEYDPFYLTTPDNEKKMYMKKLMIQICSEIEEKGDIKYHNYKFNEKLMKPSIIQYGLQVWEKKDNYISSIYYLNEYYKFNTSKKWV